MYDVHSNLQYKGIIVDAVRLVPNYTECIENSKYGKLGAWMEFSRKVTQDLIGVNCYSIQ